MAKTGLTPKQETFCLKYMELGNASEAYRQSYNAEKSKPETVNRTAKELLDNPKIAARISDLKSKAEKRHEITVDRVLKEYGKLAFLDIRKAFNEKGELLPLHQIDDDTAAAIAGFEVEERMLLGDEEQSLSSRIKKVKLSDKRGALDSLARHLGMFNDSLELKGRLALLTHEQMLEQLDGDDAPREGNTPPAAGSI